MITLLDGPVGTQLDARGVATRLPAWSADAIRTAPDVLAEIHRDYARAGAVVHTTNTFRTRERQVGDAWEALAREAAAIARRALANETGSRIAGSIAPIEDCYRPDLSPADPRPEHRALARVLAESGVDLLLCETFPHAGEAEIAVEEAVATGLPVWASLTAGPDADLMTPAEMGRAAKALARAGASAVLVNCVPAARTAAFLEAIADADVPFGAYANAGHADDEIGWKTEDPDGPIRYAEIAAEWTALGATIVGGCCGTGPAHVAALRDRFVDAG